MFGLCLIVLLSLLVSPIHLRDRAGWLRNSSISLPAPASPHRGDGHGGGGARGTEVGGRGGCQGGWRR